MTPKLGYINFWRYAFVWRYDTTNQKPHAKKTCENYCGTNEFRDFAKFEVEHSENPKTILATTSANHPGDGITLRQNRSTNHIPSILGMRARSERPPAGLEKYTEVPGNNKSKQNFRFFSSIKNTMFSKNFRHVTP